MTTSERIAAAIKDILDEDRRADRERIAELERDAAHFASVETTLSNWQTIIDDLNKQLDELTEKCAALVVERDFYKGAAPSMLQAALPGSAPHTTGGLVVDHAQEMMKRGISSELARAGAAFLGAVDKAPILRIDHDMSDPQPGKLLVVRLDGEDSYKWQVGQAPWLTRDQFVGFLVETPAVEVKEQGPWVVTRQSSSSVTGWWFYNDPKEPNWADRAHNATRFEDASIAEAVAVQTNDRFGSGWFVRTLAEARAIEAGKTPAVEVKRAPKVGDRVRVRGENGEIVHVGFVTTEVRSFHTGKVGAYLTAEIEVIE